MASLWFSDVPLRRVGSLDLSVMALDDALPVTALAVGVALDFIAGTVTQVPKWTQRSGRERAFRLGNEPTRLVRHYLWGNPRFIVSVARQGVGTRGRS